MSKPRVDWTFATDGSSDLPFGVVCSRCGEHYPIAKPVGITVYCAILDAFTREHAHCRAEGPAWERWQAREKAERSAREPAQEVSA